MSTPQGSSATDYEAIRNTLSRYCIALDTKNFSLLERVFTSDVIAKYPFGPALEGVPAIQAKISDREVLRHITSQHALTTQTIEIAADGRTAESTTYFTGIHFGQGKWKGQQVTAWGRYVDHFVKSEASEGQDIPPGATGRWLIAKRETVFMGRLGEEGVMDGE
ncbi:hypothetical protein B0A48_09303 [Cryoendolithus antarcticus]|uniref:SnoaL-like domain-containing protein n=1 Tax=Cryoendolithus antarcticus TaxID=1507870 RepID=A0A1V8T274_9PEZI|nr:hypothetical protein B0A48_09303 [Cryoendolithus antarcticus]